MCSTFCPFQNGFIYHFLSMCLENVFLRIPGFYLLQDGYTYLRTYIHTYLHTHTDTYISVCVYIAVYPLHCIYICICVYIYICTHACMHVRMCVQFGPGLLNGSIIAPELTPRVRPGFLARDREPAFEQHGMLYNETMLLCYITLKYTP